MSTLSKGICGQVSTNFCRHAIECQSIHMSQLTINQVLAQYRSRCPSGVDQDVD